VGERCGEGEAASCVFVLVLVMICGAGARQRRLAEQLTRALMASGRLFERAVGSNRQGEHCAGDGQANNESRKCFAAWTRA
jgi:hypothetical protein